MKKSLTIGVSVFVVGFWLASPGISYACERCFGAGADSPLVTAIGFSMLSLLLIIGFVFGGIASFFNQANSRARELAGAEDDRRGSDGMTDVPETD